MPVQKQSPQERLAAYNQKSTIVRFSFEVLQAIARAPLCCKRAVG